MHETLILKTIISLYIYVQISRGIREAGKCMGDHLLMMDQINRDVKEAKG